MRNKIFTAEGNSFALGSEVIKMKRSKKQRLVKQKSLLCSFLPLQPLCFRGKKDGKDKNYYLYNICDHQECYKEVGSQAISYTTGVPAMIGAMMIMTGTWKKAGVYNIEEFDPDPFMEALNKWGLPWEEDFNPTLVD